MTFRRLLILAGILVLAHAAWDWSQAAEEASGGKLFPYEYAVEDLPNGLRVVTRTWSRCTSSCEPARETRSNLARAATHTCSSI